MNILIQCLWLASLGASIVVATYFALLGNLFPSAFMVVGALYISYTLGQLSMDKKSTKL